MSTKTLTERVQPEEFRVGDVFLIGNSNGVYPHWIDYHNSKNRGNLKIVSVENGRILTADGEWRTLAKYDRYTFWRIKRPFIDYSEDQEPEDDLL